MSQYPVRVIRRLVENILILSSENRSIDIEELRKRLKIDRDTIICAIEYLEGLVEEREGKIILKSDRVSLLEYCLRSGIYLDLERLSRYLSWQDFEELIKRFLREFGYRCLHRVRFSVKGRRVEIDLIASRENNILLIDAKRYVKSRVREELVKNFIQKVEQLCMYNIYEILRRMCLEVYQEYYIFPVIVSVHGSAGETMYDVPIVSIYRFRDFISQFDDNKDLYRCFVFCRS